MSLQSIIENELMPQVEKPSRYIGSELNSVHKDPNEVSIRLALSFPDLYDIGLGNLGLHILYAILNKLDYCWAERTYAPGVDMERLLRERKLPMFTLESKTPLGDMDGIGFTLQSELTYTNILNMLDLAGIPLRTEDRTDSDPLTFCGGPAVFNPEPLVYFMDFFVFGDGEDIVVEIAEAIQKHATRADRLKALSQIEGVYVPALFPFDVLNDGQILPSNTAPKIRKRIAKDLNAAEFPVEYIVPYTKQVHDRISLEVLRGCTQGCRFCQAGMTTRPVRERSIDKIETLLERTLDATGYEEVSLVSLSTCDYSQVRSMVQRVVNKTNPKNVSVSLPSLRLDSFAVELADMVAGVRRSGLTFAPEAASPRLRAVINKWIPDEELLNMSSEAYKRGWDHVKLYFMIGLPTERDDDVEAIADLTLRTLAVGKQYNSKAKVNTGVSTFVPKPFTPFQWAPQIDPTETSRRQEILFEKIGRHHGVRFGRHDAEETFLEGLVSRADRRAGDLILRAFELGARFDAWHEHRNISAWKQAIEELDFDVDFQLRERQLDERLPWDHIDILIPKSWFQEDWKRATELKHAEDCRHSKCHRCGVIDQERALCAHMLRNSIEGRKLERDFVREVNPYIQDAIAQGAPPVRETDKDPVQRLIFRIAVTGSARFLSHLETMNAWIRTLRRAHLPVAYSKGFHPHPKVSFESARPVAEESLACYMDVILYEEMTPDHALAQLKQVSAEGLNVLSVKEVPLKAPSLMSSIAATEYIMYFPCERSELERKMDQLRDNGPHWITRTKANKRRRYPKKKKPFDLFEHLASFEFDRHEPYPAQEGFTAVKVRLERVGERGLRPSELFKALGLSVAHGHVLRTKTEFKNEEVFQSATAGQVHITL